MGCGPKTGVLRGCLLRAVKYHCLPLRLGGLRDRRKLPVRGVQRGAPAEKTF